MRPSVRRYFRLLSTILTDHLELFFWMFVVLFVIFPAVYYAAIWANHNNFFEILINGQYNRILIGALLILIPMLSKLINGKLPFEYLRSIRGKTSNNLNEDSNAKEVYGLHNYQIRCINESRTIAEKIYNRSGAYLLVGCLIAFVGVAIFYSPMFEKPAVPDIQQRLLDYLPRFGALFFVEFIAFFFLKQYRTMLEEYRYYETIKRKRQDNLNLLEIISTYKDNMDVLKIIIHRIPEDLGARLSKGETTEILEAQRLVNDDFDLLSKVIELMKMVKEK